MTVYERYKKKKLPKKMQERAEGFSSQGHSSDEVIFRAGFYVGKHFEEFRDKLIPGSEQKEDGWIVIETEPPKKAKTLYQVAVITKSGKKKVVTALCIYEKKRDKFFWLIQHTEVDITDGSIVAYSPMPKFPVKFSK